jgi:hypothetical protein
MPAFAPVDSPAGEPDELALVDGVGEFEEPCGTAVSIFQPLICMALIDVDALTAREVWITPFVADAR